MFRIILFLLLPLQIFSQTNQGTIQYWHILEIDSLGHVSICVNDTVNETIYFESYRWNRWMKIDSLHLKSTTRDTCVARKVPVYSSPMDYRLQWKPENEEIVSEKVVRVYNSSVDTCEGFICKMDSKIHFKCEKTWEIYDQYGNIVKKGQSKDIDISDLPKGGYFINYSPDTTAEFFKQ